MVRNEVCRMGRVVRRCMGSTAVSGTRISQRSQPCLVLENGLNWAPQAAGAAVVSWKGTKVLASVCVSPAGSALCRRDLIVNFQFPGAAHGQYIAPLHGSPSVQTEMQLARLVDRALRPVLLPSDDPITHGSGHFRETFLLDCRVLSSVIQPNTETHVLPAAIHAASTALVDAGLLDRGNMVGATHAFLDENGMNLSDGEDPSQARHELLLACTRNGGVNMLDFKSKSELPHARLYAACQRASSFIKVEMLPSIELQMIAVLDNKRAVGATVLRGEKERIERAEGFVRPRITDIMDEVIAPLFMNEQTPEVEPRDDSMFTASQMQRHIASRRRRKEAMREVVDRACARFEREEAQSSTLRTSSVGEPAAIVSQGANKDHVLVWYALNRYLRMKIVEKRIRMDGRALDELRDVSVLPRALDRRSVHGSCVFRRGATQVLAQCTIGLLESGRRTKNRSHLHSAHRRVTPHQQQFCVRYSFPDFALGASAWGHEAGTSSKPMTMPDRREIGHGMLIEAALRGSLRVPDVPLSLMEPTLTVSDFLSSFPYRIRCDVTTLSSDGSSSMASVCAASIAMRDAGVPLTSLRAGVAIGCIVHERGAEILVDITGHEDWLSDMDMKVCGDARGVSACMLSSRPRAGVPFDVLERAFSEGHKQIQALLTQMEHQTGWKAAENGASEEATQGHKAETTNTSLNEHAPRVGIVAIEPMFMPLLREQQGLPLARIESQCESSFTILPFSSHVMVESPSLDAYERDVARLRRFLGDVEVGSEFAGKVCRIESYGYMIELFEGRLGFLHVSKVKHEAALRKDECVVVRVIQYDKHRGLIDLDYVCRNDPATGMNQLKLMMDEDSDSDGSGSSSSEDEY